MWGHAHRVFCIRLATNRSLPQAAVALEDHHGLVPSGREIAVAEDTIPEGSDGLGDNWTLPRRAHTENLATGPRVAPTRMHEQIADHARIAARVIELP